MIYIELKKINTKNFKNINIEIEKGHLVNVIGENSSGKTSFLNLISLTEKNIDGNFTIDNIDITKLNKFELKKYKNNNISYLFEDFDLLNNLNVFDNALLFNKDKEKTNTLLKKLGLLNKKENMVYELSESEKLKLKFAVVMLKDVNIYVIDNILEKLDKKNKITILKIIMDYVKKEKKTIIISNTTDFMREISNMNIYLKNSKITNIKINKKTKLIGDIKW